MNTEPGDERPEARRTRRGEARDALLRARAADLFLERGYDSVTIDDVVRDVGGSKGSVYSFYGGKDGLFLAAMDDTLNDLTLPLKRLELKSLSLERGLSEFAGTLLSVLLQERHLAFQRLVIAEAMRHPQVGLNWHQHGPAATRAILAGFLANQQALGRVRPDADPARAATLFHDMITFDLLNRAMMRIGGGPGPEEVAETIRDAVAVFTRGIGQPKEAEPA
ncbi:MAG: TetR/AcrR family transcriptional regulator [Acidocella sp.]|uniref:TetR/AcrR family transcriptional regulator n=1 Tax=Acidocella sp. TaxID=50710 RepID=UPI003FBDC1F6